MVNYMSILAKPDETLFEHTENTLKVLKSMKEAYPNIPELCGVDDFWSHLFYSLFLHDFGKASAEFQEFLHGERHNWNYYRHEILSASFTESLNINEEDKRAVGLAIITHHKDVRQLQEKYNGLGTNQDNDLILFEKKKETLKNNFNELLSYFDQIDTLSKKYLGYSLSRPEMINFDSLESKYSSTVTWYLNYVEDYECGMEDEKIKLQTVYGVFLRGFMMSCDHLASASKYSLLHAKNDFKSLTKISDNLRTTQEIASDTKGDTFLVAPTGSGKTEASWLWAINNQNKLFSKRVFYFLPFTASINAMYKRFQKEYNEEDEEYVGVIHGKSSYFLYNTLSDGTYEEKSEQVRNIRSLTRKIYLPYKVLTPFQIIKYFFQTKGFEMGLSELTNSLLIFDEIHAYNAHTTALILSILKILKNEYNVTVMIMSATLPTFLVNLFREELNINNLIKLPADEIDNYTRHKVNIIEGSIFDNLEKIRNDLEDNKKVLIVCNTIGNAQEVFELFDDVENSALLHSRFIVKDRNKIESKINNLNLLVGTQAIEVSLDIDYDVLYSEPAPLDALIQRFGRINRKGWETNTLKDVNVCTKGSKYDKYIYDEKLVENTISLLRDVDVLYESKIQELLDKIYGEGYNEENQEEYDETVEGFSHVYENFTPFINDKNNEKSFYKLFKSYEVVPYKFHDKYLELIEKKEFYEAAGYFVNISSKQFAIQNKKGNIPPIEKNTYFIDVEYDSKLGLQLNSSDEEETEIL